MRNNKGITMMLLVITIILMILIAFMAVYYSQNVGPEARVAAAYSSLKSIKDTCQGVELLFDSTKDEYYYFGKNIHEEYTADEVAELSERCGNAPLDGDRVYIINPFSDEARDKRRISNLELSNLNNAFIVDLDNDKYYIVDGVVQIDGSEDKVYEYLEIQSMYNMINNYGN